MPTKNIIEAIQTRSHGRFIVSTEHSELMSSGIEYVREATVCRLRREGGRGGWRTILIAVLDFNSNAVHSVARWAADVRDKLPDLEAADLYMFLLFDSIPDEDAARIETDDRFCRKVVLRNNESETELLDRTFLAALTPNGESTTIGDPLETALLAMGEKHVWTSAHLKTWRTLLLSGLSGSDLAKALNSAQSSGEKS